MPSIEEFLEDAKRRMDKSIEMTRTEFNSVRTGRASAALLDRISIDYYGTPTPLKNMATIGAPEPRMLTVQPFDPTQIKAIEKAVMESDLGLTPSNDGKIVRLPIPQLTEERRKELVKLVRRYGEDGKVAIRNVRRDVLKHLEELVKNGEVGDDEERRGEAQVQKLTDEHVGSIDELIRHIGALPVLLIFSTRPDFEHEWPRPPDAGRSRRVRGWRGGRFGDDDPLQ
jgi:ribosome recycling factor